MTEINLNKIFISFGFNEVLKDFSCSIKTGEKIGLIGPNGSGKTTILRLITKEEIPNQGKITIRKNASIGYLRQIPPLEKDNVLANEVFLRGINDLLLLQSELDVLEKNLTKHEKDIKRYTDLREKFESLGGYEINKKISKIKNVFKLSDSLINTPYNMLSGGEKTIINLASLLLSSPDILLLDEPTNHLDINTMEWLEEFLNNYKGTVLIISHDRYFLDKVVNKIVCIESHKEDIYFGNYSYYLEESEKRELLEFQSYKNQQKLIKALKAAIERLKCWGEQSDNPAIFRRMHAMEKRLESLDLIEKPKSKRDLPISFNANSRTGNNVLSFEHLNLFIGDKELLVDSKMNIFFQERVCLSGPNGCGKTTLLKTIINNSCDNIRIGSNTIIGYIPQEVRFDDEEKTIYEYMRNIFVGKEEDLRSKLFQFYFGSETINKKLKTLSGGEKVRIKLLELIIKNINFLILDEPTNHIDLETRELLENSLLDFKGTILFVSHDRYFINKISTKIVSFVNKHLIEYFGNYESMREYKDNKVKTIEKEEKTITIKCSPRVNSYLKEFKIEIVTNKVYKLRKKSKTCYLKHANHLSEESMKQDYLVDKLKIPKKLFYEKYNDKSYILSESLKGKPMSEITDPIKCIDLLVSVFNNIYNIDISDCIFDETIDAKLNKILKSINFDLPINDNGLSKRFHNKKTAYNYLNGNKPKSILGFTIGNMNLNNVYYDKDAFSGLVNVSNAGIGDIYFDLVSCELSIEEVYGKEYVNKFYEKIGIERDLLKSEYYKILIKLIRESVV